MKEARHSRLPKVIVDIGPLFEDHWTGIPIFTRRLVQALMRHGGVDVEFAFRLVQIPRSPVLAAIRAGTGTFLRAQFERNAGKTYPLIDPRAHLLFPSVKESFNVSKHEASTVHDVSPLVMPEYHEQENVDFHMKNLARQLATDEVVFCVSEATRAALRLAFPSVADKTRVLSQYVDWPDSFAMIERNLSPPVLGRYAAVIGTVEPRKNLKILIRALARPEVRDSDIRFVVIGKEGWKVEQFMAELTEYQRERLLFSGYVTEFMKYRLLKHAEFLVFPSLYEGFGIPALEAMSLGKPVLAAMTSSFPELIGDAGLYFDPLSVTEFVAAFGKFADKRTLSDLAPKALTSASLYGWERMALPVVQWIKGE
jgi:glycosyltransferase involved in cell wall biosynthesis